MTASAENGHCYLPEAELVSVAVDLLKVDGVRTSLDNLSAAGELVKRDGCFYLPAIHEAERTSEKILMGLSSNKGDVDAIEAECARHAYLTDEQRVAVMRALTNPLSVVTGLPGAGKTTATRAIVGILSRMGVKYSLCTPTGKAAKRLSQLTEHPATTIHRLLEYNPGTGFGRTHDHPLDEDVVIVDEFSMVDILLLQKLLEAVKRESRLVMIGDVDQLPPVGPGNALKDIIQSSICPVTRLTKIHRQAQGSQIIRAAHAINNGALPTFARTIHESDAVFIEEAEATDIRARIIEVIEEVPFRKEDIQVLSFMRQGPLGAHELNRILRPALNKNAASALPGYCEGDRVMQLVNNYEQEVFNGEVGYVRSIDPETGALDIAFDENKTVVYEVGETDQISIAYAITVHKSQGSQFPCVILPLHGVHFVMLKRQLLYTAVSRAEKQLIIVGTRASLSIAARNAKEAVRHSGLLKWAD